MLGPRNPTSKPVLGELQTRETPWPQPGISIWLKWALTVVVIICLGVLLSLRVSLLRSSRETTITIETKPAGATIWVDGVELKDAGVTQEGMTIKVTLRRGAHDFALRLAGYEPWERTGLTVPEEWPEGAIVLVPRQATLEVSVTPVGVAATFYLDGREVEDATPSGFSTPASPYVPYQIEARASGYHRNDVSVRLAPGESRSETIPLTTIGLGALRDIFAPSGWPIHLDAPVARHESGLTYLWELSDRSQPTHAATLTHAFAKEGVYDVTLTVTTKEGDQAITSCHCIVTDRLRISDEPESTGLVAWADLESAELVFVPIYTDGRFSSYGARAWLHLGAPPPSRSDATQAWYRVEVRSSPDGESTRNGLSLMLAEGDGFGQEDAGLWWMEWLHWQAEEWLPPDPRPPAVPLSDVSTQYVTAPVWSPFDPCRGFSWFVVSVGCAKEDLTVIEDVTPEKSWSPPGGG